MRSAFKHFPRFRKTAVTTMPRNQGKKRPRSSSPSSADVASTPHRHWLMKSEPYKFSIDDLKAMPSSPWDGVRNYEARNNMRAMKLGDKVLFYHSMAKDATGVAGLAEVCKEVYPDATALDKKGAYFDPKATKEKNPWEMVDLKFEAKLPRVVTIQEMRSEKRLENMTLFKRSHLSVQPVTPDEFDCVVAMSKSEPKPKK